MAKLCRKYILIAGGVLCALTLAAPLVRAQSDGGSVEGLVRDQEKRALVGAKVSLDDQVAGRTTATQTDEAGHFRFAGVSASTYMLHCEKSGYLRRAEGPFAVGAGETKTVSLQMAVENSESAGKVAGQAMEYSDEPQFTVAGVTDPSNVGGHGSNVTEPTKEALAKETAALGSGASGTGKSNAMNKPAEELRKVAPGDFVGNLKAGRELLDEGHAKEAVAYLEKARQLKPEDYDAGYCLALAYKKSGDSKRAEQTVRALLAWQDRAELHSLLAQAKESEGQPLDAVREFQRAAEMELNEENLFSWGAELLLHRAYAPAAEVFGKGHRLYPKSIRMLVGLGAAAYAQDLNEQAARWLLGASDLDPTDPRPYEFLGKVQEVAKSESEEWVEAFRRFVTLAPGDAWAHYYYAVALEKQRRGEEDFKAREEHLEKAIAIDPRMGDAYLRLGLLDAEKREYRKAVEALQKAIEYTPLPDKAHLRLAQVYRQMGEAEKARKETELYNLAAEKKKEQLDRERREVGQFVYTLQGEKQ